VSPQALATGSGGNLQNQAPMLAGNVIHIRHRSFTGTAAIEDKAQADGSGELL
jgi:hypothetical protein